MSGYYRILIAKLHWSKTKTNTIHCKIINSELLHTTSTQCMNEFLFTNV